MKKNLNLKSLLTLKFILLAALPIIIVGFIAVHNLSVGMEKEISEKNYLLAKSLASGLERFLNESLVFIKLIKDIIENKDFISPNEMNDYLASLVNNYKTFDSILILNPKGIVTHLAPFDKNIHKLDMSYQKYYRITLEKNAPYWSKTFLSPQTGQPTLTLSVPFNKGMVVVHINLLDLNEIIDKVNTGPSGYAAIADNDGTSIAHRDKRFVLERFNAKDLLPVHKGILGEEGTYGYTFMGEKKIGSVAIVSQTGWVVVVVQLVEEFFAPVKKVNNIIWAGSMSAILIAIIISLISLRKTLRPLLKLTEDSKRIADGDYTYESQPASYTEIDNLGSSFNSMINAVKIREEALQSAYDSLEQKVKERTIELAQARDAAESANKAKSKFLANMSHEIRTPMNAVLGFTEIMRRKVTDPQFSHYLDSIHTSGSSLLSLINDILDLSKVEAGKLKLEYTVVSISHLFDEINTLFSYTMKDKGLKFIISIPRDLPEALLIDEVRLRQILINLIGNAIKFTEKGHIKLSSKYKVNASGSTIELAIYVEDTGIGIDDDQCEAIFEAFSQACTQKVSKFGGTGLGLTITKHLVEIMGGTISITSEVGKGSKFSVVIKDIEIASLKEKETLKHKSLDLSLIKFENSTLLIADDIKYNREILKTFLEDYELTSYEVGNGRDAVNKAKQCMPHLILLDMKMPEMDGYEAVKIIKKDEVLKHIPVIAVTASALKEDIELVSRLCDSFLIKPISKADLILEIMKYLPHTIEKDPAIDISLPEKGAVGLSLDMFKGREELLNILRAKKLYCQELSEQMAIDRIEEFAKEIKALGVKHNCNYLVNWGDELYSNAYGFNIEKIQNSLLNFQNIVN